MNKSGLCDMAQKHIQKGRWRKAAELMEEAHLADESDPMVTLRLGDLYKKLGMGPEAAGYYNKTADLYAGAGQKTKAAAIYKMILRMAPGMADVQRKLDTLSAGHAAPKTSTAPEHSSIAADAPPPAIERIERPKPARPPVHEHPKEDTAPMEVYYGASEKRPESPDAEVHETIPGLVELGSTVGRLVADDAGGSDAQGAIDLAAASANIQIESFALNRESSRSAHFGEPDEGVVGGSSSGLDNGRPADAGVGSPPDIFADFASDAKPAPSQAEQHALTPGKEIEFLTDLGEDELWELLGGMDRQTFGPGEAIIREGDSGDSIYIISSGRVMVSSTRNGMLVKLAELAENDFFGEVSFLTGNPRTADVTAMETTTLMVLSRHEMDGLISRYPGVETALRMFQKERVADTIATMKAVSDLW